MAEVKVAKQDDFRGISVTAEHWLPLSEVPVAALPEWLAFKRSEGYALVGLEQTTGSVELSHFRWPQRCAFLCHLSETGSSAVARGRCAGAPLPQCHAQAPPEAPVTLDYPPAILTLLRMPIYLLAGASSCSGRRATEFRRR